MPADPPTDPAFASLRREYVLPPLTEDDLAGDPLTQFRAWLSDAVATGQPDVNAMVLATADERGRPATRTVLLKGVDEHGFAFYTNRGSRKGRHLAVNPQAALTFFWAGLVRQVGVVGRVEVLDDETSDGYFASRPRGAQIGAWASRQSEPVVSRAAIEEARDAAAARFGGERIPRPPGWGGYLLVPDEVEFWQGRPDRLHDRLRYERGGDGWSVIRLWP